MLKQCYSYYQSNKYLSIITYFYLIEVNKYNLTSKQIVNLTISIENMLFKKEMSIKTLTPGTEGSYSARFQGRSSVFETTRYLEPFDKRKMPSSLVKNPRKAVGS